MSLIISSMLHPEELQGAVGRMLVASTASTYMRAAERIAGRLRRDLDSPPLQFMARQRARQLWREVLASKERQVAEFELAVMLVAMRTAGNQEYDKLLNAIGRSTDRMALWLAPVARKLISLRPSTLTTKTPMVNLVIDFDVIQAATGSVLSANWHSSSASAKVA